MISPFLYTRHDYNNATSHVGNYQNQNYSLQTFKIVTLLADLPEKTLDLSNLLHGVSKQFSFEVLI